jgi:hypothetical protein
MCYYGIILWQLIFTIHKRHTVVSAILERAVERIHLLR